MQTDSNKIIENAVGELYRGFFQLRKAGKFQEEYNIMGTLLDMLIKDRQHLRETYKIST